MSTGFDFSVETITADGQRTQTEAHGTFDGRDYVAKGAALKLVDGKARDGAGSLVVVYDPQEDLGAGLKVQACLTVEYSPRQDGFGGHGRDRVHNAVEAKAALDPDIRLLHETLWVRIYCSAIYVLDDECLVSRHRIDSFERIAAEGGPPNGYRVARRVVDVTDQSSADHLRPYRRCQNSSEHITRRKNRGSDCQMRHPVFHGRILNRGRGPRQVP